MHGENLKLMKPTISSGLTPPTPPKNCIYHIFYNMPRG